MYEDEILRLLTECGIQCFRGVFMRDEISKINTINENECGILNFNRHDQPGSHWVSWTKLGDNRYYFDSYGEKSLVEILKYLKTRREYEQDEPVIKCSAVTVQHEQSKECGSLTVVR